MANRISLELSRPIDADSIKQRLSLCKLRDKKVPRGAFTLKRCLSEAEVSRVEKRLGGALPDDYRFFIRNIGNFGTGPYSPFPNLIDELEIPDGHLSEPFSHSKAWNMPKAFFAATPAIDECNEDASYRQYWEYRMQYFDHKHVRGAIPVGDEGCARYLWLVVNGLERGTLWLDSRTDDAGILPVCLVPNAPTRAFQSWYAVDRSRGRSKRVSFAALFDIWLDRQLKRLRIKWPQ